MIILTYMARAPFLEGRNFYADPPINPAAHTHIYIPLV
jgi:hypothetical protein